MPAILRDHGLQIRSCAGLCGNDGKMETVSSKQLGGIPSLLANVAKAPSRRLVPQRKRNPHPNCPCAETKKRPDEDTGKSDR